MDRKGKQLQKVTPFSGKEDERDNKKMALIVTVKPSFKE